MHFKWLHRPSTVEEDYRKLQVDHGVAVAKADNLEQELERMRTQNSTLTNLKAYLDEDKIRLQGLLEVTRSTVKTLEEKNAALQKRIDEATVPTRPSRTKKEQGA
jgi:dynactin complex subunit